MDSEKILVKKFLMKVGTGLYFKIILKKNYVGNQKFYDVLTCSTKLPYEEKIFLSKENQKICDEIGFKVFDYKDKFFWICL